MATEEKVASTGSAKSISLTDFFDNRTRTPAPTSKLSETTNAIERFNVGGKIFCVSKETLLNSTIYSTFNRPRSVPHGLSLEGGEQQFLSSIDQRPHHSGNAHNFFTKLIEGAQNDFVLKDDTGAYFIDRSSQFFEIILDFLRTGELNIPRQLDSLSLMNVLSQQPNVNLANLHALVNHDTQVFTQRLIREADFYMVDISDQLYNIVGDGLYVSEDIKGGTTARRSVFFFDKDPIYKPASLFLNGLFLNNMVSDKEILVRNGTIEVYNEHAQLSLVIYPTTVNGDEQVNEFQQPQPNVVHQHRRTENSENALIVRDLSRFNTSFILREVKAPMQIMINMNGKNYFNLSDYNHSIKFTRVDTFHIKVTEKFIRNPTAPSSTILVQANGTVPVSGSIPIVTATTGNAVRPTTPTEFESNNTEDEDPYFINYDYQTSPTNENHRLIRPRSLSSSKSVFGSSTMNVLQQGDDNVLVAETVFRILKTNFLAKNKREFMYIESRNRVYWLTKRNLLVFELSNKNL
jgi:hypothetical protein